MIVFIDLLFNLSAGDSGGAFMEQARAGHGDDALGVYLNKFSDEGWALHEGSGHFGVVVGDGSSGLEEELELAFGRAGVVTKDLF